MPSAAAANLEGDSRSVRIVLTGHVQGVGFRPFVYRLAKANELAGRVLNKVGEVEVIASGAPSAVERFTRELIDKAPPLSRPVLQSVETVEPQDLAGFSIVASAENAEAKIFVPPDYFMCDDCRRELYDPADRRYRYPFINCTQCGPRYTLIRRLPYDRENTSLDAFPLCAACRSEYEDPADRRFHAEPVACPECGPQIAFTDDRGDKIATRESALQRAISVLRDGRIVAVKGVGGYHLVCDAGNDKAVSRLRRRKHRPDKPLAVMFPVAGEDGLDAIREAVELPEDAAELLASPMRPIVLARRKDATGLASAIAPGLAELGVFLPYAPLHQLLLGEFGGPLVATSGNLSGEPVLTDNDEAGRRLGDIADAFLHHDRPILRPADDPVFRSIGGAPRPLRIGRGASPGEIDLPWRLEEPLLAVGGHMKGTVAIGWEDRAVVSPHIGEMDTPRSMEVFETVVADLQKLYGVSARQVVCDAHPGYSTHRWAMDCGLEVTKTWHHLAHASALVAEQPADGDWLVFTWDGVGLGPDGTLWGGEALHGQPGHWRRVASMRPFRLPGGERAGRQPWRSAAALYWECGLELNDDPDTDGLAKTAWRRRLNTPETTAVGRLFDAASAVVCGANNVSYEAQGPMQLEALCRGAGDRVRLDQYVDEGGIVRADWAPLIPMLEDNNWSEVARAESFHSSMAHALLEQVRHVATAKEFRRVGLCGGVFQNRVLTEQVMQLLESDGYEVIISKTLPCNDAAISFGQVAEFAAGNIAREH